MTLTEDEAKKRWCPEARVGSPHATARNRMDGDSHALLTGSRCMASQCMAWRWDYNGPTFDGSPVNGYCGKAGRPA